jgi:hypothetical protein
MVLITVTKSLANDISSKFVSTNDRQPTFAMTLKVQVKQHFTPDASDLSTPSYQRSVIIVYDTICIEKFISELTDRMSWNKYYTQ